MTSATTSQLLLTRIMSPTAMSRHSVSTYSPPCCCFCCPSLLVTKRCTTRALVSASALCRLASSNALRTMETITTRLKVSSVAHGDSGESNNVVYVPITIKIETTKSTDSQIGETAQKGCCGVVDLGLGARVRVRVRESRVVEFGGIRNVEESTNIGMKLKNEYLAV